MEPFSTFCLAGLVFLSLPLPLFASAALGVCPWTRRTLTPWEWGNSIIGSVAGLLILGTPLPPCIALALGGTSFLFCGMQMFLGLARAAAISNATIAGQ